MAEPLKPIGFWSYTSTDDEKSDGRLGRLRLALTQALHSATGKPSDVKVWQDDAAIPQSGRWLGDVPRAINESCFFIPVVTPEFLRSETRCQEVKRFLQRETELGRDDLIFTLHYIDTSAITGRRQKECADPEVLALLRSRPGLAFHDLRLRDTESHDVTERINQLAAAIDATLRHDKDIQAVGASAGAESAAARILGGAAKIESEDAGGDDREKKNKRIRANTDTMSVPWVLLAVLILIVIAVGGYVTKDLPHPPAQQPRIAAAAPAAGPGPAPAPAPPSPAEAAKPAPAHPAALSERRDCDHCPVLVYLPPGEFMMGVTQDEETREKVPPEYRAHAFPPHIRTIPGGVYMGKFVVTRREYAAFVEATRRVDRNGCYVWVQDRDRRGRWVLKPDVSWRNPGFGDQENADRQPVVCVSHRDAQDYVRWLSLVQGREFHLPTEAEWEYAARAVTTADAVSPPRYWGEAEACQFANVADRSLIRKWNLDKPNPEKFFACDDHFPFTAPIGSFAPNAFNLHDMLGNVWQWTADCWHDNYTGRPASDNAAWDGPEACPLRVQRGGSWDFDPWAVRAGFRIGVDPNYRDTNSSFRVASYEDSP